MSNTIRPLDKNHKKQDFNCGQPMLDNYIRTQAGQDVKRDLSACFVLAGEDNVVIGYYTLSSNTIERTTFPEDMAAKLPPSYADLPTILLGRLAVDTKFKGNRYGEFLLIHALNKCVEISAQLGVLAVVVDPIDDSAVKFYENYGFILLPGSGKMFIPIKTIESSLL